MSMVWPCSLSVDEYVAAGREVEVPRPNCPDCGEPMTFWSGYWRFVRLADTDPPSLWVPRVRCGASKTTHALLPAFVLANRLDVAETVGAVLNRVCTNTDGVRQAVKGGPVPPTTARGWVRRFRARALVWAVAFGALAVELGGEVVTPVPDPARHAIEAIGAAWRAAMELPGWFGVGCWRFVAAVTGAALIATNTNSPYFVVGNRRFMPPVP